MLYLSTLFSGESIFILDYWLLIALVLWLCMFFMNLLVFKITLRILGGGGFLR